MADSSKVNKSEMASVALMEAEGQTFLVVTFVRDRREESFILGQHEAYLFKNALGWQLDKLKITE